MGAVKWNGAERTETDDGIIIKTHREFTGTSWDDLLEIPVDTCLQGSAFYNITAGKAAFWDGSENWVETDGTEHSGIPPVWKVFVSPITSSDAVYLDNEGVAYEEGVVQVEAAVPDQTLPDGWSIVSLDSLTVDNPNIEIVPPDYDRRYYHTVTMNGELGHFEATTFEGDKKTFTISPYGVCSVDGVQVYYESDGTPFDLAHDVIHFDSPEQGGVYFVFKDGDEYLNNFVAEVSDDDILWVETNDEDEGYRTLGIGQMGASAHTDATARVMFRDRGCAVTINVRYDID